MTESIRCKACKQLKNAEDELRDEQARLVERSLECNHVKKQVTEAYAKIEAQKQQVNDAFAELNRVNGQLGPKSMSVTELRDFIKDIRNEAKDQSAEQQNSVALRSLKLVMEYEDILPNQLPFGFGIDCVVEGKFGSKWFPVAYQFSEFNRPTRGPTRIIQLQPGIAGFDAGVDDLVYVLTHRSEFECRLQSVTLVGLGHSRA